MPALPLTTEQLKEAAALKALFKEWQLQKKEAGGPVSQEQAANQLGFGQSAFSQYLNGKIPLNLDAAAKFAALLECAVVDFSPSLAAQAGRYASTVRPLAPAGSVSRAHPADPAAVLNADEMIELMVLYQQATERGRRFILDSARAADKRDQAARWILTSNGNQG